MPHLRIVSWASKEFLGSGFRVQGLGFRAWKPNEAQKGFRVYVAEDAQFAA